MRVCVCPLSLVVEESDATVVTAVMNAGAVGETTDGGQVTCKKSKGSGQLNTYIWANIIDAFMIEV